jgi:endonuclease/exonuclease/phosphatase (EEP) superfamily protein YafD
MFRRLIAAVFLLAVAAALLVLAWPQLFGLQKAPIIAQIVSFRGAIALAAIVCFVLVAIPALASRRFRRFGGSLAALLLIFVLANAAVLGTRGFGGTMASKASGELSVVSWNTLGDAPGAEAIAKLALDSGADIVTLPETTIETTRAVASIMAAAGHPMQSLGLDFGHGLKARSTSMLISTSLGTYVMDETMGSTKTLPTVIAKPKNGSGPTIVAVHTVAPVPKEMRNWRSDLLWLSGVCTNANTILSGDFNATIDHLAGLGTGSHTMGSCTDAGSQTNTAAVGTWPTAIPAVLGAPIDHVMAGSDWKATGMRVVEDLDHAGSDHRPIVAHLARSSG